MSYDPTDALTARALFEDAIGLDATPALTTAQVDRYFALASSLDDDGVTIVYRAADLNRAAAAAWDLKANLTADKYDLGGGAGRTLDRSQWHEFCVGRAAAYRNGTASVTGERTVGRRASGSVQLVGSSYVEPEA